ncbi:MAG: SH3 domain-containing protein [Lachnospiraceae bacterium]|nr:SH3 domain-containing protein [Lachnospiraceae bacterium]
MKKTTINTILLCIIAIMSVSICFLIFCIVTRPRYVTINESASAAGSEVVNIMEEPQLAVLPVSPNDAAPTEEADAPSPDTMHGKTSTRVNIRNAASEDAKVLNTVDEGTTFDIIEIQDNGWTKILYNGSEAYISSNFVIITND